MKITYLEFLDLWEQVSIYLSVLMIGLSICYYIYHKIIFLSKKNKKEKYDYASQKDIKNLLNFNILIAIAIFFIINALEHNVVEIYLFWFFIRIFIAGSISFGYAQVVALLLKYYYPGVLAKKLHKLRYTPRINKKTKNKMKLLNENEEDVYLNEGKQAEEGMFSIDYDVWIDPETKDTLIEKYKGYLSAMKCDRCNLHTLKIQKEKIIKEATKTDKGEIEKEYKCRYCKRIKRKKVAFTFEFNKDTHLSKSEDATDNDISILNMSIRLSNGEIRNYDFYSIQQSIDFLKEFNLSEIEDKKEVIEENDIDEIE